MGDVCRCVARHNPRPQNHAVHHILPQSWGGKSVTANLVKLCPTGHENVHTLLNLYVHAGDVPSRLVLSGFNPHTRMLAKAAWDQRPNDRPPYTDQHGVIG